MDFQRMGKKAYAEGFERGNLKAATEKPTNRILHGCEKPPEINE